MSPGLPKFGLDVGRGRILAGYILNPGESHKWMYVMALPSPGDLVGTRAEIPADTEVALVDAETGAGYLEAESGHDWLIKAVYFNFNQPVRFRMYSDYVEDHVCISYFDMYRAPLDTWIIGWVRTYLEPITSESKNYFYVKNIGDAAMLGKAWIIAFTKEDAYAWV